MKAKHITIKNSIEIIVLMLVNLYNPGFAQDTIYVTDHWGQIIKNTDGTFYYSSHVQLDNRGGYITTLSYGRWTHVNDSTYIFTSSATTKHEILKSYELYDSIRGNTNQLVDIYNENGDLLCKWEDSTIHHYAESSVLGISVCDTSIQIYGVSPYGQWHLDSKKKEKTYNHHIVYIRDAFYYNLEYLCFYLIKNRTGEWLPVQEKESND